MLIADRCRNSAARTRMGRTPTPNTQVSRTSNPYRTIMTFARGSSSTWVNISIYVYTYTSIPLIFRIQFYPLLPLNVFRSIKKSCNDLLDDVSSRLIVLILNVYQPSAREILKRDVLAMNFWLFTIPGAVDSWNDGFSIPKSFIFIEPWHRGFLISRGKSWCDKSSVRRCFPRQTQ